MLKNLKMTPIFGFKKVIPIVLFVVSFFDFIWFKSFFLTVLGIIKKEVTSCVKLISETDLKKTLLITKSPNKGTLYSFMKADRL